MEVFVIGTRGFPNIQGGVEKHCESLYRLIAKKDSSIRMTVFRRKPYLQKKTIVDNSIDFIDLWTVRNKYLETIIHSFQAAIFCIFKRPDLVHIHNIGPALVLPLLKIVGLKAVVTYHSDNYNHEKWGSLARSVLKIGEWFVGRMADRIIVVSKRQLDLFAHKENVLNIPNGVKLTSPPTSNKAIQALGLVPGEYILSVARFVPEKGLDVLVRAFRKYNGKLKLVIAGDADHETTYSKNLKRQIAFDSRIIAPGYISGDLLADIFSKARVFIIPSYHEGLPIALLEALGYGIPAFASDIPANREIGLPDRCYFKTGDIKDLLNKIEFVSDIILTPEEKERQIKAISEKYDWESIAKQTIDVYKVIARNQSAPLRFRTT